MCNSSEEYAIPDGIPKRTCAIMKSTFLEVTAKTGKRVYWTRGASPAGAGRGRDICRLRMGENAMAARAAKDQAGLRDHRDALDAARTGLPPLVAVAGENEFLRARAVDEFRSAWFERFPAGDAVLLQGSGEARPVGLPDIARELSGGSLFANEKLVIVRRADRILFPQASQAARDVQADDPPSRGNDREKAFLDCLDNPGKRIWLVLETAQLPKNRILGKRIAERCAVIPCPSPSQRDIPAFLQSRARESGRAIDNAAIDLLHQAHGTDLGVLASEMDKLVLFAGEGEDIDAAMVEKFLTGTLEFDVFGFTNAVEARDPDQAILYARRITMQGARDQKGRREDGEKSAHRVMAMLAGTVQGLLRARVALSRGMDAEDFASREKLAPWRADRLLRASRAYSLRELRLMAAFAADQVRRTHDTGGDVALGLELMAVRFTRREGF